MEVAAITKKLILMAIEYAPKVALAIITLVVGFWVIKRLIKVANKFLRKSGIDLTLSSFISSIFGVALKMMLLFSVAGMFGVNTTSFIAVFSALMVGIGMALNGTLGHAASGVLLMIFKPFKVGDLVVIGGGNTGSVHSINAFNTTLETIDNRRIIIANSNVTGNNITNISGQGTVGVELTFGIGYAADIDKARKIILEVGKACPYILNEPAQAVVVENWGDSSVDLGTRPFCKSEDFRATKFYMKEHVKKAFDKNNINIPFPTMDIHMAN